MKEGFVFLSTFCLFLPFATARLQLEPGTKAVIKLGVCPYPNYLQRCSSMQDECIDDLDCAHEALCCNDGCHRVCSIPRLENVVGYVVLGAELPLNTPTPPTVTFHNSKSLSVSSNSWNLLLGYLCAVADRLHSTNQFQCKIPCQSDSDCPRPADKSDADNIRCCNDCCLDPSQFIVQQRTNPQKNSSRNFHFPQHKTTFHDSSFLHVTTTPAPTVPSSKAGMCPPVLVQAQNGFLSGPCDRRCHKDSDCYGPEKCCSNGCGYACQRPISFNIGYGGEGLPAAVQGSSASHSFFPERSSSDYVIHRTTTRRAPMLYTPLAASPTPPVPITVLLGAQPRGSTEPTPSAQRCTLPPTSYTECIGISPWRTRYYYHKGLNQCLPIYRCVRSGNNFYDLSSCENSCVEKSDFFY